MDWRLFRVKMGKLFYPRKLSHRNPTNVGFIARWVDRNFFEGDQLYQLPKDGVVPIGAEVDGPESTLAPSEVVEHFIRKASYRWIMNFCICRDANHCHDYPGTSVVFSLVKARATSILNSGMRPRWKRPWSTRRSAGRPG